MKFLLLLLLTIPLMSCTVSVTPPWKVEEEETPRTSYVLYDYVHTNPPGEVLAPPILLTSNGTYTSPYNENEMEAYAAALISYHSYLVRYINAMEGSNGETIVTLGNQRCAEAITDIPHLGPPPKKPSLPTITTIEKSKGSTLIVEYLGDVDKWLEDTEDYYGDALKVYNSNLATIAANCL